ncbi:molybdopterin cofactor-binding domain-containing protein [Methylobacterium oryzae CBMB20]
MSSAWTRWTSGSPTTPRSSRSPASRSPPRPCGTATAAAPRLSAGPGARSGPARRRDKDGFLVGTGMGTATFPALIFEGMARAEIRADGTGTVELGAIDMGQGSWTALAQIAADGLGIGMDALTFRMGSSRPAECRDRGRLGHTATAGGAVHAAAADVIRQLAELATNDPASPLYGAGNAGVTAADGRLTRRDDPRPGQNPSPTSSGGPAGPASRARARPAPTRRCRPPTPCTPTARSSPR